MWVTLCLLALASALFISGKVRSDMVAIGVLIVLLVTGILTPPEALSGFSSTVVIMMIGLFVVGGGIFQTGLARMTSNKLLQLAGTNETSLLIMVMLVTVVLGAFVSNTGTVAVLMPIVISLAMKAGTHPGRLLMPVAFASSLGGTLTLIGTPPNLIIQDTLTGSGFEKLSFFSFAPVGLVCIGTGIAALLWLRRFLPQNEEGSKQETDSLSSHELVRRYQMIHNLFRVQVNADSPLVVKKLSELEIPARFEVNVIEIRRKLSLKNQFLKTVDQEVAGPGTVVQEGDILYVYGPYTEVRRFAEACNLTMLDRQVEERPPQDSTEASYVTDAVGVAELMLTPYSRINNLPVSRSRFREKYRVNIVGIKRKEQYLLHNLKDITMRDDDIILIQGKWKDIELLASDQEDVVVIGQPMEESRKVTMDRKAPIAAGVMLLMIILLVTELVPAVAAVMISACLMVLLGCVRNMEEAYKTVNWGSVVLIGGMIPMSIAIEKTGAAGLLSEGLVGSLGSYGPMALLAGTYFATSAMTLFLSNTTCAVLLAPIALSTAVRMELSPYPFLFAVAIGAGMCFAVPFSTPPNAMVMAAGRYKFMHYLKVGLPLQLIIGIVMVMAIPLFWPF
ncbi:SLC13 family permease [Paenibacillus sambharensis]|uniref:SLC13 family permease n=1 Tax=Paenibacillus sambharensis TaxID=1803190 RepID=A0A2W1LYR4_9BACL|nr:SLC13 family permease [Paenibacillus sambharensis]PZD96647.1 SLC13 family permease [Paenibacillus sambharensis]